MLLRTPTSLHYPITITELLRQPDDHVERSAPIFAYSYESFVTEGDKYGDEKQVKRTFITNFEVENDGTIVEWLIHKEDTIAGPK